MATQNDIAPQVTEFNGNGAALLHDFCVYRTLRKRCGEDKNNYRLCLFIKGISTAVCKNANE
jgi:hypothetical protein